MAWSLSWCNSILEPELPPEDAQERLILHRGVAVPLVVLGEIPDERRPVPPGRVQRRQEQLLDEAVAVRPAPDPARELLSVEFRAALVRDGEAIVRADLSDGFGKVSDRRRLCVNQPVSRVRDYWSYALVVASVTSSVATGWPSCQGSSVSAKRRTDSSTPVGMAPRR